MSLSLLPAQGTFSLLLNALFSLDMSDCNQSGCILLGHLELIFIGGLLFSGRKEKEKWI